MNKRVMRPLAIMLLCGAVITSLQGCIGLAVGTTVMGTLAATDRRTLGAQTEDKAIAVKGEARIPNAIGDGGHVNVASFNRKVLLTGEVASEAMKAEVERVVSNIDGVQSIVNELEVLGSSSFGSRSNDSLITGKVKASFVDSRELYANAIKVVTERGNVYLMGLVTQREGQLAADIAASVSGVQKVIKVFEYISDDELRQLSKVPDTQPRK